MPARIALFSLLVPDYDPALDFFLRIGFECREDTDLGNGKRWVRIAPPGGETEILLARAVDDRQSASIGEQGGGRVWLFLETDDFESDYQRLKFEGVEFETPPRAEPYGRVAVWKDPWGNRWDLIEFSHSNRRGTGH
jgi:catechol 2,3-dioxygenase-like lactoylglutathione lyase family enzyme